MSELKSCPFCGGGAYKHKTHHEQMNGLELEKYNVFHVTCRDCCADIRSPENTPLFCEELWNHRTEPNEALTVEEVMQMDGQPAYFRFGDGKEGWAIVCVENDCILLYGPDIEDDSEPDMDFYGLEYAYDTSAHFGLHILGWVGYRHKPEGSEGE